MRKLSFVILTTFLGIAAGSFSHNAIIGAPADEDFAGKAANGGKMEVELGRLAAKKGRNAAVRTFGRRMVTDHTKAGNKLKMLAAKKHMTLPTEMDAESHEAMQRLSGLQGAQFDRAYMDMMVSDHEKDITEFETESQSGADADLKAFATSTLPTLKVHLQLARDAAAKVK
ncbi:MAG TPA: DUF4142 domain-containing protein [Pyrinomonadaceae bacterium]|jgi:putative membrane protein|nr:DUF4142 domain-containing protein [Pyrinomonadaceae bacterium]